MFVLVPRDAGPTPLPIHINNAIWGFFFKASQEISRFPGNGPMKSERERKKKHWVSSGCEDGKCLVEVRGHNGPTGWRPVKKGDGSSNKHLPGASKAYLKPT